MEYVAPSRRYNIVDGVAVKAEGADFTHIEISPKATSIYARYISVYRAFETIEKFYSSLEFSLLLTKLADGLGIKGFLLSIHPINLVPRLLFTKIQQYSLFLGGLILLLFRKAQSHILLFRL